MAFLKSNLTAIAREAPELASEALLQTGKDILAISQTLVPVDTSSLKKSGGVVPVDSHTIHVGYGSSGVFFSGREPAKYANAVEFGTGTQAAQPYLVPAFAQGKETFRVRLTQKMKALEKKYGG